MQSGLKRPVADLEVQQELPPDGVARYLARRPSRFPGGSPLVVVAVAEDVDRAAWDRVRPLLDALEATAAMTDGLPALLESGFDAPSSPDLSGRGWYVADDPGQATLASGGGDRDAVVRAVAQAARAAHALHEAGVAHQGISPASVHTDGTLDLPALGPDRTVEGWVLDLADRTRLDTVDPAVARGEPPSRASDVYALGATLFAAVAGRLLHPEVVGDAPIVALQRVMFEPVRLPGDLDPAVAATVAACVSPDPSERPPDAAALALHLDRLVAP